MTTPQSTRAWSKIGAQRWTCPPWSITGYDVGGEPMYALWHGESEKATSYDRDRKALMGRAAEIEKGSGTE